MRELRDLIATVFTSLSVTIVASLVWWIVSTWRNPIERGARSVAWGIVGLFTGILLSQAYMAMVAYHTTHFGEPMELTPYAPVGLASIVVATAGTVALVWWFRPPVPRAVFLAAVAGLGLAVGLVKLFVWPLL